MGNFPEHSKAWIGVDFDRTLATYTDWATNGMSLGAPLSPMVERIKRWLAKGLNVKVLTARVSSSSNDREEHRAAIEAWCEKHIGQKLEVTAEKDFDMVELWDDRAVRVDANLGTCGSATEYDPLTTVEELRLWREDQRRKHRKEEDVEGNY